MTTWTPKAKQAETWTEDTPPLRVFSLTVFSRFPTFDTGTNAGFWTEKDREREVWTTVA